jgi:hypothetical protein
VQKCVASIYRTTNRLLAENTRLQEELHAKTSAENANPGDLQRKRLKLAPDQCITGDDILEQRRMEKEKADSLIGNYNGLNMEDFLHEFNLESLGE